MPIGQVTGFGCLEVVLADLVFEPIGRPCHRGNILDRRRPRFRVRRKRSARRIGQWSEAGSGWSDQGKPLGKSLAQNRELFPGAIVEMISVAEESGKLDVELMRIAGVTEGDLDRQLKSVVAMAEPVMLFVIAAFIGTIFIGMVIPIFSLQDHIK